MVRRVGDAAAAVGRGPGSTAPIAALPTEQLRWESRQVGTTGQIEDLTAPHFDSSVLLVIDAQVDFLDGGAWTIPGTSDKLPHIAELAAAYRSAAQPIVHVVRLYEGDDVDLVRRTALRRGARMVRPGSPGSQIAPAAAARPGPAAPRSRGAVP